MARHAAQLWERFRPGQTPPATLGASRDYNVDMVPKFIMANGNLVKVLPLAPQGGTLAFSVPEQHKFWTVRVPPQLRFAQGCRMQLVGSHVCRS